jgi:hypothetical protein
MLKTIPLFFIYVNHPYFREGGMQHRYYKHNQHFGPKFNIPTSAQHFLKKQPVCYRLY